MYLLLLPVLVFSDMITFKVGYFIPRAQSDLWDIEFENMDFDKNDFFGTNFGFTYEYFLSRELSIALSIDGYSRKKVGIYEGFVGISFFEGDFAFPDDFEGDFLISHVFDVSITPFQLSLKLAPMGRKGRFIPYVGGGVGIYLWNVRLQGDIINFDDVWEYYEDGDFIVDIYPVEGRDIREENKIKVGFHALGGIMFPVANRISVEAEFKFNLAEGKFSEDNPYWGFFGFEPFDLSGYQLTIGLNYWF